MKSISIPSINPFTQEVIQTHSTLTGEELENKISEAHKAYLKWKNTSFDNRSKILYKVADLLEKNREEYAYLITTEMGKPINQAHAEICKCMWVCKFYAEHAEFFLQSKTIKTQAQKSYICYESQGIVLGVMPWNFPFWQVFRFCVPAIMAGNSAILKHASNVMGCAKAIENIFKEAELPNAVFSSLIITSNAVEKIINHPYVTGVVLTGSEKAGSNVAAQAGRNLKKSVLELGGSNALIVMEDCDIKETLEACIQARFLNVGQSCIAGKRLLLHRDIAEEFITNLLKRIEKMTIGDPLNPETYISVLAREDLAETLEEQVDKSIAMGAKLLTGGKRDGAFYPPTVLADVSLAMPVCKEETFGPVLPIIIFDTLEEAIKISNETDFGLGVSIFTNDSYRIEKNIARFEEGCVFINDFVKSDPRLPFGGIKRSGYGRELSKDGIMEFVNKKTVVIK